MAEPKTDALVKSLEGLVAEKEAVTTREKELIDGLNAVLSRMGYRVVATNTTAKRRGRPQGSAEKRRAHAGAGNDRRRRRGPGRPPGSGKKKPESKPEAKRRGRPPKVKTASK